MASFDKRIANKTRRRPNLNPNLDYSVVEAIEFPMSAQQAEVTVCQVDGSSRIYIGDKPEDFGILNDDLGGARSVEYVSLQADGRWKFDDGKQIEVFEIGKPKCPSLSGS